MIARFRPEVDTVSFRISKLIPASAGVFFCVQRLFRPGKAGPETRVGPTYPARGRLLTFRERHNQLSAQKEPTAVNLTVGLIMARLLRPARDLGHENAGLR